MVAMVAVMGVLGATSVSAQPSESQEAATILRELGFSLNDLGPDKPIVRSAPSRGLLVPTPWGEVEATIVSTPVDRMVRVPLSPNSESSQGFQPYVTAGTRKNVDSDPVLEQAKPSSFADSGRTNLKAGAGVIFRLDNNVELFGEYQFMRLQRESDGRGSPGPLGTTLDASGFSLGLSVRY